MLVEFVFDLARMALFVVCAYAALNTYARHRQPGWEQPLGRHRLALLGLLTLSVVAVKVIEDVVAKESGPVDEAILWFVRQHVPAGLGPAFAAVTQTGSARVLVPLAAVVVVALLLTGRRREAWLVATSLAGANLVVYLLKGLVGRARPELWDTQWYWGSSFPSGHTLSTAAFSTACALGLARIRPRYAGPAMALAVSWTVLVALSRLVLGVHWPSDVLAALCLGMFIPLAIGFVLDLRRPGAGTRAPRGD